MDFGSIQALKNLVLPDDEDEDEEIVSRNNKGSVLNPSDIGGKLGEQKELAPAYSKIETKINTRNAVQNLPQPQVEKKKPEPVKKYNKNDIWDESEIQNLPKQDESRPQPEFDILLKQRVGTEDIFLGINGSNPTSSKCQDISIKIQLPNTKFKEVQLDVTKNEVVVQTPKYFLHHHLPYPVNEKEGKAKWISDKYVLELSLPIIRNSDYDF